MSMHRSDFLKKLKKKRTPCKVSQIQGGCVSVFPDSRGKGCNVWIWEIIELLRVKNLLTALNYVMEI